MSNINLPFDIESLEIISQHIDSKGNIVLEVESKGKHSTCHKCGNHATKRYGHAPIITVQHTSILNRPVYLKIKPVRYQCEHCDDGIVTTEQYDWCSRNAKVTHAMEDYIMRSLINSTIEDASKKTLVGYKTVGRVLDRKIGASVDWRSYKELGTIGIDEIALKKGHNDYVTIVSAKSVENLNVIAVLPGRSKATVKEFLASIPAHLKRTVNAVCTDMHDGFVFAAMEVFGKQKLVVDRYHVSKLYREPLDKLRIKEMKRLKKILPKDEYQKLDNMMWVLRKKHECLSEADKSKLAVLYQHSPELKQAHQLCLKLTQIFNTHHSRKSAMAKIHRWIKEVENSSLSLLDGFIKTLKRYKPYIANYFKQRKNSGFVEGLNNKIKVAKRRCYGILKPITIFQRLQLDLCGYDRFSMA